MIEKWEFLMVLVVGLDLRNEDMGKGERGLVDG